MQLIAKPADSVFHYWASFQEPILDQLKEVEKISLARKFMKAFELRVTDLRYNAEALAGEWVSFSKFVNPGFFDVSFGVEEFSSSFRNPTDETQLIGYQSKLFGILQDNAIALQRMTLREQLASDGDSKAFLESLNPYTPARFVDYLVGKGVIYDLEINEHNLKIHISLSRSLYIEGGLFLFLEAQFSPNVYGFTDAFNVGKNYYEFILSEMNLTIERAS